VEQLAELWHTGPVPLHLCSVMHASRVHGLLSLQSSVHAGAGAGAGQGVGVLAQVPEDNGHAVRGQSASATHVTFAVHCGSNAVAMHNSPTKQSASLEQEAEKQMFGGDCGDAPHLELHITSPFEHDAKS
jgi:hypothetical protein